MKDKIFENFLRQQTKDGEDLARSSEILKLISGPGDPPQSWIAILRCSGFVHEPEGLIQEVSEFHVGIHFDDDYLRRVSPSVVTLLRPLNTWHPNVFGPVICLGHIVPGMPLVGLIAQVHEILTFQNWASHDGLNPGACQWARQNQHLFPTDRRALKGRSHDAPALSLAQLVEVSEP